MALAPPGHPERPAILARWAEAARQSGRHAEATAALEEAVAAFKEQGDTAGAARAMTTLSNVLWFTGDPRSRELAAEAVALLESKPPGPDLVAAYIGQRLRMVWRARTDRYSELRTAETPPRRTAKVEMSRIGG